LEEIIGKVFNAAIDEKAKELIVADRYERTEGRKAYRNGYRTRWVTTRLGSIKLKNASAEML
jgi:transposase-like protein